MVAGLLGVFFLAVLYLQRILGYNAVRTGAAFLPISLSIGVLSVGFSARLNGRFGPRAVLLPALASIAAGLVLLARVPVDGTLLVDLLPAMLLLGIGGGLAFPALMTLAMSGVAPEDSGLASGPRQHDPAGRRRPRPRDPGHRGVRAHRRRNRLRRVGRAATTWPSRSRRASSWRRWPWRPSVLRPQRGGAAKAELAASVARLPRRGGTAAGRTDGLASRAAPAARSVAAQLAPPGGRRSRVAPAREFTGRR